VLKSNDQAKSNPEQTVKYNLLNTRKTLKVETAVGEQRRTRLGGACLLECETAQIWPQRLIKTERRPSPSASDKSGRLSPSGASLECFPTKTKEN
jgi:hypothetical protein